MSESLRLSLSSDVGTVGYLSTNSWCGSLRFTTINAIPRLKGLLLITGRGLLLEQANSCYSYDGEFLCKLSKTLRNSASSPIHSYNVGESPLPISLPDASFPSGFRNPGIVEVTYGRQSENLLSSLLGKANEDKLEAVYKFVTSSFDLTPFALSLPEVGVKESRTLRIDVHSDELALALGPFNLIGKLTEAGLCLLNL